MKRIVLAVVLMLVPACTPTPKQVCDHMLAIGRAEGITGMEARYDKCIGDFKRGKIIMSEHAYNALTECIMDSTDVKTAYQCDVAIPYQ